ncbi:hypothetical protein LINPERHAP1_LOCUS503 [Linum perenne]
MKREVQLTYGIIINSNKCYRARSKARDMLEGTLEDEYKKLRPYVAELQRADPEGRFCLEVDVHPGDMVTFKRIYVGFSSLFKGFLAGCRPIIGFDGCFLKGELPGMLLSAIGKDGNNQIFPLAWAVTEGETTSSWKWFVELVVEQLRLDQGNGWTVISDQQKGLIQALEQFLPNAEHRKCARHVFANWKLKHFKAESKDAFWKAVYSSNTVEYEKHAKVIKELQDNGTDKKAYDDFIKQEPKRFCRAFLSTACKSDSVESNLCESFNNAITRFRDLRIIKLLEGIRSYIMVRIVEQHKAFAALKDSICPSILEQIEWTKIESRRCSIQPSLDDVLECTMRGRGFVVDLRQSHCTCGYWQLSGVPCVHAVAGLAFMRYDITDYVDQWYSVATAKKAYAKGIPPFTGREDWREVEGTQVLPPSYKVLPGRPKKNRRKEPGEIATRPSRTGVGTIMRKQGVTMHCSRCGQPDHNIRGCNMTPEEAASLPQVPPPKPIGRPRRQPVERPHPVQPNAQVHCMEIG